MVRASSLTGQPKTAVAGENDGLGARPNAELVEKVRDVVADGLLAQGEALGDGGVAQAFGHQSEDPALADGQPGESRILAVEARRGAREFENHAAEALPGGLVLEQDVILRLELHELGARD